MTIAQLRTFLVVCESMSFTQAAQQQYISQPAVSRQISGLEDELGAPLFERSHSGIQLTAAGQHLALKLRPILDHLEALFNQVHEIGVGQSGSLSFGLLIDQHLDQRISTALQHFRHRHNATITIYRYTLIDLLAALKNHTIDLAISIDSTGDMFSDCERYIYAHDTMCFAVRRDLLPQLGEQTGYPARIDYPTLREIAAKLPILGASLDNFPRSQKDVLEHNHNVNKIAEVDMEYDLASIAPMVSAGLATTIVNATHNLTVDQTIALVPMTDLPPIDKGVFWMPDNHNPLIASMVEGLKALEELPLLPPEL